MAEPIRVGVIGMGGFAGSHHRAVHTLEGQGLCRLVTGCDPHPERFDQLAADLAFGARGVRVYDDYMQMLEAERDALDVVTIPAP
ncbi:MAG: Gfo/Idh/MocA family oxidoreductase, partial [Armatimonadetes bacterium]|nr:Gfo/Idh/MocA family oxidoreductase [Armatimonadota bacterium]